MRQNPTPEERLKNAALFLCLAEKLAKNSVIGDRLKIQKCTFLVTLEQFQNGLKGFDLTFFRHTWGPFSKELYVVEGLLKDAGLIESKTSPNNETGEVFVLTEAGVSFASELCAEIWAEPENGAFEKTITSIGERFRGVPTPVIVNQVYDLEVQPIDGPKQKIRDMRGRMDITRILESAEAKQEIIIKQGWLETLAIMVSPESRRGLEKANEDLAAGRTRSHAEVWASV